MVEIKNVFKTFKIGTPDEKVVFDDFSLSIEKGEFVSLVGSNGSGKTTLLNIICGDVLPESGSVILDGKDITKLPNYKRSTEIARVFQNPAVGTCPSMTIYENMSVADNKNKMFGLTPGLNKKRKDFYKEQLSLLKMGLEDRLSAKAGNLSGGQRQALALIMATLATPKLLILDEHTAALDPKSSDNIMSLTDRIVKEKNLTAIMVTHNLRYAVAYGTRAIMMHGGKCVMDLSGAEKSNVSIDDFLGKFNEISIECGN